MDYNLILKNTQHIDARGILSDTKNKKSMFIPLAEAIINSLEAIKLKNKVDKQEETLSGGRLELNFFCKNDLSNEESLEYIEVIDNGIGFSPENYKRFIVYMKNDKGFNNKGTGRYTFINFFQKVSIHSFYRENGKTFETAFDFSATNSPEDMFLSNIKSPSLVKDSADRQTGTTIRFLLKQDTNVKRINITDLKNKIIENFLFDFVINRDNFPVILIRKYFESDIVKSDITIEDIPKIDKTENTFKVPYKKIQKKEIVDADKSEQLRLFFIKSSLIKENKILFTSSKRSIETQLFPNILKADTIDGNRYMVIVEGDVLDDACNINNERSSFSFITTKELSDICNDKQNYNFEYSKEDFFVIDGLQTLIEQKLICFYPEINSKIEEKNKKAENLKDKFLIPEDIFEKVKKKMPIESTEEEILQSYYDEESSGLAKNDLEISYLVNKIKDIDLSREQGKDELNSITNKLVRLIPNQNRTALGKYVARRKLILDMFENLLSKNMNYKSYEKHFHNLFFYQHSSDTEHSNLWLLNEDFIYFQGVSEENLSNIMINDEKIFKDKFTEEEKRYLNSLGEKRLQRRPDVLLFPSENKCVLIEFKGDNVNLSHHINQITEYATLIYNYTKEKFKFEHFYGYLIGEKVQYKDVRAADASFLMSYDNSFYFRSNKEIANLEEIKGRDGSLYTEIITYSSILKRAKLRNSIFINKLGLM